MIQHWFMLITSLKIFEIDDYNCLEIHASLETAQQILLNLSRMGCSSSTGIVVANKAGISQQKPHKPSNHSLGPTADRHRAEVELTSALKIQRWFRSRRAIFAARKQSSWKIFQRLEYQCEDEQVQPGLNVLFIVRFDSENFSKLR